MLLFLFSLLYSTKIYHDENQLKVTSFEFNDSKKNLYQENINNSDSPIHLSGRKNKQISVKKIEASKYIIIDSITINVDELIIDDVDKIPIKIVNGGKISIQNTLYISSKSTEKVYIPKEINTNSIEYSNGEFVINSASSNSKSIILHNAKLSFEGNSFFANSISGDSDSIVDLQKTSSLTVETIEGNLTILCSSDRKTNLYISKQSRFSNLIISNDTDFFAMDCTIDSMTVFPTDGKSEIILFDLFDSKLNINRANLSNCLIMLSNRQFASEDFDLESTLSTYDTLIELPDITINDIFYQGNVTFSGKSILLLAGSLQQIPISNPLILLSDETSTFTVCDEIFILINSTNIEANSIHYNLANLFLLQSKETNLELNSLHSFSLIDFSTEAKEFNIEINNENLSSDANFYISTIGKSKKIELVIDNNASKIVFSTNLTDSDRLSIEINSTIKSSLQLDIIEANTIEFTELNNVFDTNYVVSKLDGSVIFGSIGFTITEDNNDIFYLTYKMPSEIQSSPHIEKVNDFKTVLIHDVYKFPTFSSDTDHLIELRNCHEIELDQEMAKLIKTINNSSIHADSVEFSDTFFYNCNLTSSSTLSFIGGDDPNHEACIINILDCSGFSVKKYHSLLIENIIEKQSECSVSCSMSHLHISTNDNNLKLTLNDVDSYVYINEKNNSNYKVEGKGNFILKNANEIDDDILSISGFSGSFFIYNCQSINISNDEINNLENLLILSSEYTVDSSLKVKNIGFYNSSIFIAENDIELQHLVLYNSMIRSSDNMNLTDDELYGTLTIKDLLFNGDITVTNLNLLISHSVNSMANFYQQYQINQSVFIDLYNQEIHSKLTMIPSDKTKITFGLIDENNDEIVFGDNYEFSLFSFHGNSIMNNETIRFLNFEYFFSSINFTNNKKLIGNIKSTEFPTISFDTNKTKITCPLTQKVIIINEREKENYTVFDVACSSNDNYDIDEFISGKNCTSDEFNSLICFTENENEIESIQPKVVSSNSFLETEDVFNCEIDSIKVAISNLNNARINLNISNNCEVTFYDKQDASLDYLNMTINSKLSIYRNMIDNTSLIMSENCVLTILDSFDEYYQLPSNKSNTTGYLHLISMTESSMNCDFKFNLSTCSFYSSSCSFTNSEIFILKVDDNQENENENQNQAYSMLENTLLLTNSRINISKNVDVVKFTDFQYNGKSNSIIYIYGNANFSGICHSNGVINCPNEDTTLDFTQTDSAQEIILYDLQINCTLNFSQIEASDKLHLGGTNSIFRKGTIFIPSNLSVFVEGRIHFFDFNMIDSITYLSNYTNMIDNSFVDDFYGRPEIIFSNYENHEIYFNISGQANITILDENITFTKSFETFNDSVISFSRNIVFQEGATFNGHHIIEGSFDSLDKKFDRFLWTNQFFIFNEFSSEGQSLITVQSNNITIKDQHNENTTVLLESIQDNLMKIQNLYNLSDFFNLEINKNENNENENENETDAINDTNSDEFNWENIKILSTNYFLINLFSHRVIKFHHNEISFNNTNIELYGGSIRDVSLLSAENSEFNIKDDYIESEKCTFTDSKFTNYMSSIGCLQLTTQNTEFYGYVDIYHPKNIDMKNVTVNLTLPNSYPIFNIHNIDFENEDEKENYVNSHKTFLLEDNSNNDYIFDLKIRAELNVNLNKKSHETAKLFMFDVMPNSLPIVTTTQTRGDKTEYLFNSEIVNNRIITFKSLKCGNVGEYNENENTCIQCMNGSYSYEDKCIESPEGMFVNNQMKSNRNCPIGFYSDKPGQATCTKCPKNMITMKEGSTSKSDCVCTVGFMFDNSFSTNDDEKCIKCPEGLACNRPNTLVSNVKILEGYYYYNKDYDIASDKDEFDITDANLTQHLNSSYIYKCLTNNVCLSQVQSDIRLTKCRSEYNGFLCSKCKKNYFHLSISYCRKCSKFPIVALVFGPIIHIGLIWFCFIYDSRYCAFLYFFMLFTQHYSNIYQIDIKWPPIFTYVAIIFESINLDFRRFFDCEANDEIWSQGFIFMIINCAFTACYILFFIVDFKNYRMPSNDNDSINEDDEDIPEIKDEEKSNDDGCCRPLIKHNNNDDDDNPEIKDEEKSNDDGCCRPLIKHNNNNDRKDCCDRLFKNDDDDEKPATRVIQILTIYYFMTFLTQFRWLLSVMASKNGHLIVYPYIMLDSYEYKAHIVVIIVNSVYFFGFLLFFLGIFFYFYTFRPITIMFLMFKYILFDVKYEYTFIPFIYVVKSVLMCFFVVYLNNNWFINLYLIVVLIFCLDFFLYAWPFYNKYIRSLELCNILFQMFIVSMGIMAQQTHSSFEIFSIILMAVCSAGFIAVYIFYIYHYKLELPGMQKEKDDYNNMDPSDKISKKEIFIKYRNEFNQFFFYDDKFNLNIIAEWLVSAGYLDKFIIYKTYFTIRRVDRVKNDFRGISDDVNSLMHFYRELFISFYASRDARGKEEIRKLLSYALRIRIKDSVMKSFITFSYAWILKEGQKLHLTGEKLTEDQIYDIVYRISDKFIG